VSALRAKAAALAAAAALLAGCALPWWLRSHPHLEACPGPVVSSHELPGGDFLLRERVRVEGEGEDGRVDAGFELVVERRGGRLAVVGLNPFGAKAFSLVQRGRVVQSETHLPRLPLPPENLLYDLHAARFAPDRGGPGGSPDRVDVARIGCGYAVTFSRAEYRALDG